MLYKYMLYCNCFNICTLIIFVLNLSILFSFSLSPDLEYRHGIDYRILFIHLPNSIFCYFFFFVLLIFSIYYFFFLLIRTTYFIFFSFLGLLSVVNCLGSGFFWAWSQWGSIPLIDFKVSLMIIFFIFYLTCSIYTSVVSFFYVSWLCFYVSYLIPLLRYNVFWFSDIHQKSSIRFSYLYITNFSFILFAILCSLLFSYFFFFIFLMYNFI